MPTSRVRQRTVYLITGALVACLVGGFALAAAFTTGGQNTAYQGSQQTTVDPIAGLDYVSTNLTELTTATGAPGCSVATPCNVETAGVTVCAGGFAGSTACNALDYVEQVNLTTIIGTQFPGTTHTVKLTLFVTGTPVGGSSITVATVSFYFQESSGAPTAAVTISLDFDVGTVATGPGLVEYATVIGNAF